MERDGRAGVNVCVYTMCVHIHNMPARFMNLEGCFFLFYQSDWSYWFKFHHWGLKMWCPLHHTTSKFIKSDHRQWWSKLQPGCTKQNSLVCVHVCLCVSEALTSLLPSPPSRQLQASGEVSASWPLHSSTRHHRKATHTHICTQMLHTHTCYTHTWMS